MGKASLKEKGKAMITPRIEASLYQRLKRAAKLEGCSVNCLMCILIDIEVKRIERKHGVFQPPPPIENWDDDSNE